MLRLEHLTTEAAIARLVPEWAALWDRVPDATPFQSPHWLLPWWRTFGTEERAVIAARAAGRLVGVLPLYLRRERGCRKLLPIGISLSDWLDALVEPAVPGVADALLASIVEIPDWDECHLPDLPSGAALLTAACPAQLTECRAAGEICTVLSLPNSAERLPVPRKLRQNLRRARARAAAVGSLTVMQTAADTLQFGIQELFRLHEKAWRRRGEAGVCATPDVRDFHMTAACSLLAAGMLRLYLLRLDGETIAACYGFAAKGRGYAYLSGFDPDHAEMSPGTQLLAHMIEAAIAEGAGEFHFLRGGEAYKRYWGVSECPNTTRTFWRRG